MLNKRYLIEYKIGYGGFSTVWMAYDLQNKKDIALKVMFLEEWGGGDEVHMQDKTI